MKKLFAFLLLGVFMISFASAAESDNGISNYDEDHEVITFKNGCIFGICFGDVIGQVQLKTPKDFNVARGYNYVWELDAWVYEDYSDFLKSFELEDMNNGKAKVNRNIDIKILSYEDIVVDDYYTRCYQDYTNSTKGTQVCESIVNGSHIEQKEIWTKVTPANIKKANGKVTLRGYTEVQEGDKIDWSPLIFGVRVSHNIWAIWTESLNANIESYWKFEEASGTIFDSTPADIDSVSETNIVYDADGIILDALNYTGNSDVNFGDVLDAGTGAWSISGWFKTSDTGTYKQIIGKSNAGASNSWEIRISNTEKLNVNFREGANVDSVTTGISVTDGDWHFFVATRPASGGDIKLYLDDESVLTTTNNNRNTNNAFDLIIGETDIGTFPMTGTIDEIGIWSRELSAGEVIQLYNDGSGITYSIEQVSLNYPQNSSTINDPLVQFNWTLDPQGFNITNWTLNVFFSNGTLEHQHINTSININESINVIHNDTLFLDESYIWNVESCQTEGTCFTADNQTFDIVTTQPKIIITNPNGTLDYNYIGGDEVLNVTFISNILDSCWYNYNGTNLTIDGCVNNTSNSTNFILEINNFNMTIYANDTAGNMNSTFINWSYTYLEKNRTLNTSSHETSGETFTINVEGPTSASLFYNGTEYTTTKSGNDFTRTIQMIAGQLGNHSVYWRFDDAQNSFISYQNVSETVFALCNTTYTTPFLNISFKDEEDLSIINGSIPTSTFEYWLGDGTVTKTLTFINTSENFNYEFCATPSRTFNFNSLIQYKQGSNYPQRVFSQDGGTLTNDTTDLILYLLGVSDGLFVTFQVLNVAEQPISDVDILATRVLEGSDTPVAQGTTDAAGSVTFWLNPDFQHTITFEKTGLDTETLTIFPTQTAYTVSMGGGTVTEPDQTRGVSLVIKPQVSFLVNDTLYNFNYTVSSEFWNLDEFGFTLFYSNGTEIGTETSTASSGGVLDLDANTLNSSYLTMTYYYLINETYTNNTRIWYVQNTEGTEYSISNFFSRFTIYINAGLFGFDDFGKALVSFLILVMVSGGLSSRYGINSEVTIMGIIFGLVLVLDVGLGLIPNPQLATEAGIENIVTVITGILLFGILMKEELR